MAQVKAHEATRYINKPNESHRTILIYGPDRGLVSERASLLARNSGIDLDDPFSTIRLDADDAAEASRLADEAHTVSMFGGNRLVWVKGSTQRNLAKAVQPLLDLPPSDAIVLIEAGDLKKSAPLRSRIEKSPSATAIPCYADQAQALDEIINEETRKAGLQIDQDARSLLKSLLGGDRIASRGEVQKLCLYALEKQSITMSDIEEIVGDASALAIDTVIDAASTGDMTNMEHTLKRLLAQGTSPVQIVLATQRHFQMLHQARCSMDANRQPASSAVDRLRPPVNFQRKGKVSQALTIWSIDRLLRALDRLETVSLETRAKADLAPAILATALLALTIEARQARR